MSSKQMLFWTSPNLHFNVTHLANRIFNNQLLLLLFLFPNSMSVKSIRAACLDKQRTAQRLQQCSWTEE